MSGHRVHSATRAVLSLALFDLEAAHAAHAAHAAAHATHGGHARGAGLLRQVRNERFGGHHQRRDARRVHEPRAHDLRRVNDAGLHHVDVLAGLRVKAERLRVALEQLADHHRALFARVLGDLRHRRPARALNDLHADLLVQVRALVVERRQRARRPQQRAAAARHDALGHRGARRVERVHDAVLLLAHLDLARAADLDHCDAATELREPLLQLLLLVLGRRRLDRRAQ
ncbi:hypothetical protein PybrP1_006405 [[Pythium] brassicae (nom. inval.)]|nr:hypothetical protein PybrP1_006405 [[Pythium] brassicae (nom. inval.)]